MMIRKKTMLKKVTPMFTKILTTAAVNSEAEARGDNGIINPKLINAVKELQTVISVGNSCRFVKPGDVVSLNFTRYGRVTQKQDTLKNSLEEHYSAEMMYNIPTLTVNGEQRLFVDEGDISFIVEELEEVEIPVVGLSNIIMA